MKMSCDSAHKSFRVEIVAFVLLSAWLILLPAKANASTLSLHSILAIPQGTSNSSQTKLTIYVFSAGDDQPVFGAEVTINMRVYRTNRSGWVLATLHKGVPYDVYVTRPGFEPAETKIRIQENDPSTEMLRYVYLKREMVLTVRVKSEDDNQPVPEARVSLILKGETSFRFSIVDTRLTDASGVATLHMTEIPGAYRIEVKHGNFKPAEREYEMSTRVSMEFGISLERKKKDEGWRSLIVTVVGADANGKVKPIEGAKVSFRSSDQGLPTDSSGVMTFSHHIPMGEEVSAFAEADGYTRGSGTVIVGQGQSALTRMNTSNSNIDEITITLKRKLKAVVTITVLDEANDKPIAGAKVNLEINGAANVQTTNAAGQVDYHLGEQPSNVRAVAKVSKSNYKDKWSDLPSEYLQPKEDPSPFTVFLKNNDEVDLSGDWTLLWNWSVTYVNFVGNVTGAGTQWSFQGTLDSGGNAIWHPAKGSGTATCTLTSPSGANAHIQCTAILAQGKFEDGQWKPVTWQGEADGTIQAQSYGAKRKFGFRGRGSGSGDGGPKAGIDHLDLAPKSGGGGESAATAPSNSGSSGTGTVSVEYDTDRPGADYRNFDLPEANFELCRSACAGDANCKAYTYVKPAVQGSKARCWLKSSVPGGGKSSCCISGTKP